MALINLVFSFALLPLARNEELQTRKYEAIKRLTEVNPMLGSQRTYDTHTQETAEACCRVAVS